LFSALKADLERVLEAADGSGIFDEDEDDLQRALAISRQEIDMEDEEADLRRAIQLSMQGLDMLMCTLVIFGEVDHVLNVSES
jgi:ataxin-3